MIYKTLEYTEPQVMEDVFAGTFFYKQEDGEEVTAKFFVRCNVLDPNDPDSKGRRQSALNEQMTEQWSQLMLENCSEIVFKEVDPSPFF